MKYSFLRVGIFGFVLIVGLGLGYWAVMARPYRFHGSVIEPASPAPALALPATDGSAFDLTRQRGKVVMVFFGFTNCKDVCPATMAQMRQLVTRLGPQGSNVQVVFVSVDPRRDSLTRLKDYVTSFNPSFLGLTGTDEQLEPVWMAYGVYHHYQVDPAHPDDYDVEHTTFVYVIDPTGKLRMTYAQGAGLEDMVADLTALLKEG